jgi:hypothetical protein
MAIGQDGYKEFWRREEPPKHRYIQILPQNKKERKDLMSRLKHEIQPYPKDLNDYNTDIVHHTTYTPEESNDINFW